MNNFFYYLLFSSAILFYGIGLGRIVTIHDNYKSLLFAFLRTLIIVELTSIVAGFFTRTVLSRLNLFDFFPFFTLIIFLFFTALINYVIYKAVKDFSFYFSTTFLFSLLAVQESSNFIELSVIALACVLTFYLIQILLVAFKKRFDFFVPPEKIHAVSLIYINIAILIFSIFAWNVSWLNPCGLM